MSHLNVLNKRWLWYSIPPWRWTWRNARLPRNALATSALSLSLGASNSWHERLTVFPDSDSLLTKWNSDYFRVYGTLFIASCWRSQMLTTVEYEASKRATADLCHTSKRRWYGRGRAEKKADGTSRPLCFTLHGIKRTRSVTIRMDVNLWK